MKRRLIITVDVDDDTDVLRQALNRELLQRHGLTLNAGGHNFWTTLVRHQQVTEERP